MDINWAWMAMQQRLPRIVPRIILMMNVNYIACYDYDDAHERMNTNEIWNEQNIYFKH